MGELNNSSSEPKPIRLVDSKSDIDLTEPIVSELLNKIPIIGGLLSNWYSQKKQRVVLERIQDCLNSVVNKLHKIDYDIEKLESDEEFAELTVNTLERVIKTLNAQKREYFSNLIANSAVNMNSEKREEMRSMSALLDQLEIVHILTLEKVMKLPHDQSVHFFGPVRTISDFDVREFSKKEHHALGTLDELGLIDLSEVPIGKDNYVVPLKVNSRGISFHKWITEPKN